jgi:glutamate N-acetyltransferase/amino-acid N-acetyltransferase
VLDACSARLEPGPWLDAAKAIMTTDTYAKVATAELNFGGARVALSGIAKGSGMIAPDMATMLSYVFTDMPVSAEILRTILGDKVKTSFNAITVDSDTSTSDTLLIFATGAAGTRGVAPLTSTSDPRYPAFADAVGSVLMDLALQVVRDGEGASKFVTVTVSGATSDESAMRVARAIANSPLVKTAIAGEDANWGRVVMAVGKAGEPAERDLLSIRFGTLLVAEKGERVDGYDEEAASAYMKGDEIAVSADLGLGEGRATVYTCDLTHGYVDINGSYRS